MGGSGLKSLRYYAPVFVELAREMALEGQEGMPHMEKVYDKVVRKWETEPVEDYRIDFEDGYGNRPDAEEDAVAVSVAGELATGMKNKTLSPFIGIRIKPFTEDLKYRSVRTLDLFVTELLKRTGGVLPANFVVMLPKVTIPEQVSTLGRLFDIFERGSGLPAGSLKMETFAAARHIIIT